MILAQPSLMNEVTFNVSEFRTLRDPNQDPINFELSSDFATRNGWLSTIRSGSRKELICLNIDIGVIGWTKRK